MKMEPAVTAEEARKPDFFSGGAPCVAARLAAPRSNNQNLVVGVCIEVHRHCGRHSRRRTGRDATRAHRDSHILRNRREGQQRIHQNQTHSISFTSSDGHVTQASSSSVTKVTKMFPGPVHAPTCALWSDALVETFTRALEQRLCSALLQLRHQLIQGLAQPIQEHPEGTHA